MKKSNLFLLAVLVALLALGFVAMKSGWSPTSFWTKKPTGLRLELQEFDKKIEPVADRRAKILTRLEKIESEEKEARKAASDAVAKLSAEERESFEKDLLLGKLSSENAKNPLAVVAFARCQEAFSLSRQTKALRDGLAKYEIELVRAFSERDRLVRRVETSEALGYDPDDSSNGEVDFGVLDELAAQTDETIAEQANRDALNPFDAASSTADERAKLVDEIVAGREVSEQVKIDESLDAKIDALAKEEETNSPSIAIADQRTLAIIASVGFALAVFVILALGVRGFFSMMSQPNVAPVVDPFANVDETSGAPVTQRAQQQPVVNSERVLQVLLFTLLGGLFFGPFGAGVGCVLGLFTAGWKSLARTIGAIGLVILALLVALIVYGIVMIAIFI